MVERVPLHQLEQIARVHHLETEMAVRLEDGFRGIEDSFRMFVVCERVAPGDDIRAPRTLSNLVSRADVEEAGEDVQPLGAGDLGDVPRDVDTPSVDPTRSERREQHTVVATELDHPGRPKAPSKPLRVRLEVADECRDRARGER